MNGAGSLWILALMVLILTDVIGRGAFGSPLRGVPELVGLSIVGIVFLQLAYAVGRGRLTRSEALIDRLRGGWPRVGHLLDALFHLFGTIMFTVIAYIGTPLFLRSWRGAEYVGVAGYFTAPTWPVKLIIVVGSACAGIEFARRAWGHVRCATRARTGG
jgi:TRAP-type C4-dicarboxylate transport system permease small subunit